MVLYGLVCILPRDLVYTSDPTRECGGCADGARDLVLVFELYNLSNILFLTVHSCYTFSVGVPPPFDGWLITSSVHSYLRFIFTAGVLGLVLYGLVCILPRDLVYTSIQPANAGDAPMAQEI